MNYIGIQKAAVKWMGTPFHPHACVIGGGVDCVNLAAALYEEAGVIEKRPEFPPYTMDGGKHLGASTLSKVLASLPGFEKVNEVYPGALLVFNLGRVTHHIGVALTETRFIHALQGPGVIMSSLREKTYSKRLKEIWIK